ncbi:4-alpha-glucanotransferase (amylomaltase) [hydrothermal vent metagenome]|uniref:4-alpha-glucanotransferase n=1 Tax=hydrothermal vent metagenome TaxID=652676 RepID=A0A3B0ZAU3_9ZZZZ
MLAPDDTRRRAGVLLHPTSLPGGDLGADAYRFVEFLQHSGATLWQMLPTGPTHADGSPYQCLSVNAGNELLISLEGLVEQGWLQSEQLEAKRQLGDCAMRRACLSDACRCFLATADESQRQAFNAFCESHHHWLHDFALYRALRQIHRLCSWVDFPAPLRDREPEALAQAAIGLEDSLLRVKFEQYIFFLQWQTLKTFAQERGVLLFGDMPIFVAHDSAEVWAHRKYFLLDDQGQPIVVAGVPPDYFSETGQRWGNPLYNWQVMADDGYQWWIERLRIQMELFDVVRIDHFRGFEAYWEIPSHEETAINGHWVKGPGNALFEAITEALGSLPLVAEDLGLITPEVHALRERFQLPGMKILQFAFDGGSGNSYLPHNHEICSVVYTGTHDNDTSCGWFNGLSAEQKTRVMEYLGCPAEEMPWPLVRAALASVALWSVIPMQDILALDSSDRMNIPGTSEGNWTWRFDWHQLQPDRQAHFAHLVALYGR